MSKIIEILFKFTPNALCINFQTKCKEIRIEKCAKNCHPQVT